MVRQHLLRVDGNVRQHLSAGAKHVAECACASGLRGSRAHDRDGSSAAKNSPTRVPVLLMDGHLIVVPLKGDHQAMNEEITQSDFATEFPSAIHGFRLDELGSGVHGKMENKL